MYIQGYIWGSLGLIIVFPQKYFNHPTIQIKYSLMEMNNTTSLGGADGIDQPVEETCDGFNSPTWLFSDFLTPSQTPKHQTLICEQ